MEANTRAEARNLLESYLEAVKLKRAEQIYTYKPADLGEGRAILAAAENVQAAVLSMTLRPEYLATRAEQDICSVLLDRLARRTLPYETSDVQYILERLAEVENYRLPNYTLLSKLAAPLRDETTLAACRPALDKLKATVENFHESAEKRRLLLLLSDISGKVPEDALTFYPDRWGSQAGPALDALDQETQNRWLEVLRVCGRVSGGRPSNKWLAGAADQLASIGTATFAKLAAEWLGFFTKTSGKPPTHDHQRLDLGPLLDDRNTDFLKGLAWASSLVEDERVAAALGDAALEGFRKIPGHGPRASKVANACLYALGRLPVLQGAAQLERVRLGVKQPSYKQALEQALDDAAERAGLLREDLEEITVPAFGLDNGALKLAFGEAAARVEVTGADVSVRWTGRDGKPRKAPPAAVKRDFKEELKNLKRLQKDLANVLNAQRSRLERLPLGQRAWPYRTWQARYLDHPLLAQLVRRLVWRFEDGGQTYDGAWFEGRLVDVTGQPLELSDDAVVRPWHPVHGEADQVQAWRTWLERRKVTQPFKQAHREVYLLTDAERRTRTYSNRFAAHVLRQHQFNSLCAARGWKNYLRLMVDDEYPPAYLELPQWGLRAEFWVEGADGDYGVATNETGTYLHLTTDQVRFYTLDAPLNYAHAGGGGYRTGWRQRPTEPLSVVDIPPVVLSEVMRDVDLFVGVASVGNDPTWSDGGPTGRYRDYWQDYAFGELSASAQTRAEVLARLLPRLQIGAQCILEGRFLCVQGSLHTYKIHLGSGNVLMSPNDRYLCIVPDRRGATADTFLPFEGDGMLAIILSKAFLLADDASITDPVIVQQIR